MTSCPEAMGWDSWWFWKKALSWDPKLGEACWDLKLDEASSGCAARLLGSDGQHSKNCVSLSSCRRLNSRSQWTFRTWTKESRQCFGIPMHMNVLHIRIFHIFVSWSYFGEYATSIQSICIKLLEAIIVYYGLLLVIWSHIIIKKIKSPSFSTTSAQQTQEKVKSFGWEILPHFLYSDFCFDQ